MEMSPRGECTLFGVLNRPFFGIWPCHLLMGQIYGSIERVSSQDLLVDDARD